MKIYFLFFVMLFNLFGDVLYIKKYDFKGNFCINDINKCKKSDKEKFSSLINNYISTFQQKFIKDGKLLEEKECIIKDISKKLCIKLNKKINNEIEKYNLSNKEKNFEEFLSDFDKIKKPLIDEVNRIIDNSNYEVSTNNTQLTTKKGILYIKEYGFKGSLCSANRGYEDKVKKDCKERDKKRFVSLVKSYFSKFKDENENALKFYKNKLLETDINNKKTYMLNPEKCLISNINREFCIIMNNKINNQMEKFDFEMGSVKEFFTKLEDLKNSIIHKGVNKIERTIYKPVCYGIDCSNNRCRDIEKMIEEAKRKHIKTTILKSLLERCYEGN